MREWGEKTTGQRREECDEERQTEREREREAGEKQKDEETEY